MSSETVSPRNTPTSPNKHLWARGVLCLLVFIHFVLPFTPINQHDETRIVVASLILGTFFLGTVLWSFKLPKAAFTLSLAVLLFVYGLSHVTAASPISEGWPVKIFFAAGLASGIFGSNPPD